VQSQENKIKSLRRSIIDMIKVRRGAHLGPELSVVGDLGNVILEFINDYKIENVKINGFVIPDKFVEKK